MANKPPPRKQPNNSGQSAIVGAGWSGPLPPPHHLQQFDSIVPGSAERIIAMAEREQAHRHKTQQEVLDAEIGDTRRGQYAGVLVSVLALVAALWTALAGVHWLVPIAFISVPVMGVAQRLIKRRKG